MAKGADLGATPAGFHAMNACRMEKGYRHWGHDIYDHITPPQAGLNFAVAKDKDGFMGKEALEKQQGPLHRRLVHLAITSSDAPFMIHDEPVYRDGKAVGLTTSAAWGHRVGQSLAIAELTHDQGVTREWLTKGSFEVEVALQRYPIRVQLAPFYDPKSARMKD
jgi:4-methylaminobutanoate oxidase (formaldehyde-forming)